MKIRWKQLFIRASFWLLVELSLTFIGLDDLADYSEFVFERNMMTFQS